MSIKNRVVVISGATGGLGRVATRIFAEQGARLTLFGRTLEKLESLAESLDLDSDRSLLHAVDVNDPVSAQAAAEAVQAKFGQADIYLHLVGGWIGGKPVIEVSQEEMSSMLEQHLWSTFHMTQAFVPLLVENQWGRVIVISSPNAHHPPGKNSPYSVGKAAEEALVISLAHELIGSGVTANILTVKVIDSKHEKINNPSKKNRSWTTPEELVATMLHLCSDQGGMINGSRIPIYGSGL